MRPADNELFTRVGPGTKMGKLLRRYWHPIAASDEMTRPTKAVRILCESLVLFRDALGGFGLLGDRCPHRRASLLFGMPDGDGLRCATMDGVSIALASVRTCRASRRARRRSAAFRSRAIRSRSLEG